MRQQHPPGSLRLPPACNQRMTFGTGLCHLAEANLIIGQRSWWEAACLSLGCGIWLLKDGAVLCLTSAAHVTEYAWFRQGRKSSASPSRQTPLSCVLLFPDRLCVNVCFSIKAAVSLSHFYSALTYTPGTVLFIPYRGNLRKIIHNS